MRRDAFTLVELLLAVALSAMVAAILAAVVHGLVRGDRVQTRHLAGPDAARSALLRMARDASCAFAPDGGGRDGDAPAPFSLTRPGTDDPAEPDLRLEFHLPVPSRAPYLPGFYGLDRVVYEVRRVPGTAADAPALRELVRRSAPCAGPRTNDVATAILLRAPFTLDIRIPGEEDADVWPLPSAATDPDAPALPPSILFTLRLPGCAPLSTETLVHCAHALPPRGTAPTSTSASSPTPSPAPSPTPSPTL